MARRRTVTRPRPRIFAEPSTTASPASSAFPSTCASELSSDAEDDDGSSLASTMTAPPRRFAFLHLPLELRQKVYSHIFATALPDVLDLDPSTFDALRSRRALSLFLVSKQIHLEATVLFFGTNVFRLFPIHPGRYFKTKRPLLARLPSCSRALLTSLELRLGPGWADPPRGWIVNDALGLQHCTSVRLLKILVECDPSDAIFKGFRRGEGFYEKFCETLLRNILDAVPSIETVQFDAWSSVKRDGAMIVTLERLVAAYGKTSIGLTALCPATVQGQDMAYVVGLSRAVAIRA